MNAPDNAQASALERSGAPAEPATTSTPSEQTDAPYASAQPTPEAAIKKHSMLPPIAIAQPLGMMNPLPSQIHGSTIAVHPNAPQGIYRNGVNGADPYGNVVAVPPPEAVRDAQSDDTRFASLKKCRWFAICLMIYYMVTLFFGQPFVLSTTGMFTALIGFNGSRAPVDMHRFQWLRWYIRGNYLMLILNMWMIAATLILPAAIYSDASDAESSETDTTHFYANSYGFFIGLIVAANTIMHLRALLMAQQLLRELEAAGIDRQPALVLAAENPTSTV